MDIVILHEEGKMIISGMVFSTVGNNEIEILRKKLANIPVSGLTTSLNIAEFSAVMYFMNAPYVQLYGYIPQMEAIIKRFNV